MGCRRWPATSSLPTKLARDEQAEQDAADAADARGDGATAEQARHLAPELVRNSGA